jgi:hypothetical protein
VAEPGGRALAVGRHRGRPFGAREAERLGLQRAPVAVAAGWQRWQRGDRTAAISDYAVAVVAAPTLASDPFWSSDPEMSAARPAIMDAALQQLAGNAPLRFTLRLLGGDAAAATAELASLSAADRAVYDLAVAAWQGLPGAEADLQQLAERQPLDPVPVGWCQLVAIRHDEQDLVARYGMAGRPVSEPRSPARP